jgi:hypothetical protein
LPSGSEWLHEIKHDGFRIVARKKGAQVKLYSQGVGVQFTEHMAGDGEIVFRHGAPRGSHADHGYAATPEAAMRAFAKSWRRE